MAQHTPGPWIAEFEDIGNGSCQWRIAGGDEALVADSPVGKHAFDRANARLIAAAPELLAAMKELVGCGVYSETQVSPFRNALTAIAKAEEGS